MTDEIERASLDEQFRTLMTDFFASQEELLRLASFVTDRAPEIDDRRANAYLSLRRQLPQTGRDTFDGLWDQLEKMDERVSATESTEDRIDQVSRDVHDYFAQHDPLIAAEVMGAFGRASTVDLIGTGKMMASLLTTLVGDFEVLVGRLAKIMLTAHPGQLAASERSFTWKDIAVFGSLDDFKEHAIDRAIEDMLRGSFGDWIEYFRSKQRVTVPQLAEEPFVLEVFQRRHVIVHNGGRVSRLYVLKCGGAAATTKMDEVLVVDAAYFRRAADALSVIGLGLAANICRQVIKTESDRSLVERLMGDLPYRMLLAGRFWAAREICREQQLFDGKGSYRAMVVQVNGWLAEKRLGRLADVQGEIELWDTTPLAAEFQLAKLALLDQLPKALALTKQLRGTDALPMHFFYAWPLLEEVRAYEQSLSEGVGVASAAPLLSEPPVAHDATAPGATFGTTQSTDAHPSPERDDPERDDPDGAAWHEAETDGAAA